MKNFCSLLILLIGLILGLKSEENSTSTSATILPSEETSKSASPLVENDLKYSTSVYRMISRRGPPGWIGHLRDVHYQHFHPVNGLPMPPPRPARFRCRHELYSYLRDLHTYYSILSRPKFGRRRRRQTDEDDVDESHSSSSSSSTVPVETLIHFIDRDRDGLVSRDELVGFFSFARQDLGLDNDHN